ncbi:MAG: putative transcriptional regulator [Shewanella sp.]|jgi:putative transcriptional regulator
MINYHPKDDMLLEHAKGSLNLAMTTAVSAHCELCSTCKEKLAQMTQQHAHIALIEEDTAADEFETSIDLDDMLNSIMLLTPSDTSKRQSKSAIVTVKGHEYILPKAFRQQVRETWNGLGKISRMRLETNSGDARASLLHIDAGGEIPQHTHQGTELTLLLAGHFEDEFNHYGPGDFILLDSDHQHSPKTEDGCLCYTVVDAPLRFTKGLSKLLNPIGELIY